MPPLDDEGLAMVRNTLDLGDEAREFLNSHLGEYLLATAQEIIDANLKLLKDVNPYEIETVRKYQNNIRVAENSIQWIVDAIQSANEILDQEEAEDDLEVEN